MDIILLIANMVILSIVAIYFARASRAKKDVEYTEWLERELFCAEIISFKK